MAFSALNGYNVEHASQLATYENLFGEIQHINGKGCIDTYTKPSDIESVTMIDVMRVLPYAPRFRQLGATNNGTWHNKQNEGGYGNAPESTKYQINVDLIYDEGIAITNNQIYSNPVNLKAVIMAQLVKTAGMSINVVTYAKQIEAYFRNGDNFDKALTHAKGAIVADDITSDEIANSVFAYDPAATGLSANSPSLAFQNANANLDNGIIEIGAFIVPREERQAFVSSAYNTLIKGQYAQNASEASARILATGFINPFTASQETKINAATGLLGMYDGVDMFLFNAVVKKFVYVALGILGTANDAAQALVDCRAALDKLGGILVYGAGTLRGIIGPSIEANPNPYFGGVYILPKLKMGVEVIHGASIKMIINGGAALATTWSAADIAKLMNNLTFTPIDGNVQKATVVGGFNTGTHN